MLPRESYPKQRTTASPLPGHLSRATYSQQMSTIISCVRQRLEIFPYVRDIYVILGHVQPRGDVGEVQYRSNRVTVEDESFNQPDQSEGHVHCGEEISARMSVSSIILKYVELTTERS